MAPKFVISTLFGIFMNCPLVRYLRTTFQIVKTPTVKTAAISTFCCRPFQNAPLATNRRLSFSIDTLSAKFNFNFNEQGPQLNF